MHARVDSLFDRTFHPTHRRVVAPADPLAQPFAFDRERFGARYADFVKTKIAGFGFDRVGQFRPHVEKILKVSRARVKAIVPLRSGFGRKGPCYISTMDRKQRWIYRGVIFGCWTAISLVYSSHLFFYHNLLGEPTTWRLQLAEAFADFYVWAALTPAILVLARRYRLVSATWYKAALVHLLAALGFSLVQVAVHTVADLGFIHGQFGLKNLADGFQALFARTYHFGLLVYLAVVGIYEVVEYYRNQEVRASRLQAQLAEAQLRALKMQLHPHFLFNTLHAVSALMHKDVKAADRMIARLSEFLRLSLDAGAVQEVALKQELEFLDRYLEIEKIRFQDRLTVTMSIDPATLDAKTPNLILQPLVENSIRHGIAKRAGPGAIEIAAVRREDMLELTVADNGVGCPAANSLRFDEGIGLTNTRLRLEQLYGARQSLSIENRPEGGVLVTLRFPFVVHALDEPDVERVPVTRSTEAIPGEPSWSPSAR